MESGITFERGAKRIHFHEFMKEVHQDLHIIKKDKTIYDPLPHLAEKISNELRSKGIEENLIKKMVYSQELDWKIILKKEFKKKYSQSKIYNIEDISKIKNFFFKEDFL